MRARHLATALSALAAALTFAACGDQPAEPGGGVEPQRASVLEGSLPLLTGEEQDLADFEGDVVLVVNTASECGYTSQFEGLQELYEERRPGFTVLGFPADDVAGQEPRDDAAIKEFCEENFGVEFPMFAKSDVVGESANPLFQRLADVAGEPTWNFNKYLLDRNGQVVEHYEQGTGPDDLELNARIDELL